MNSDTIRVNLDVIRVNLDTIHAVKVISGEKKVDNIGGSDNKASTKIGVTWN